MIMARVRKKKSENGWEKYQVHVLEELKRMNGGQEKLGDAIDAIKKEFTEFKINTTKDVSALKVKAGIWGGIAGLISAIGAVVILIIKFL